MLNDLVRNWVVALGENLAVPLDGQESFVDEKLVKVGRIRRQHDAATALYGPMANRADISRPVNTLEYERLEDAFFTFNALLPVFLFPPSLVGSVEATSRL